MFTPVDQDAATIILVVLLLILFIILKFVWKNDISCKPNVVTQRFVPEITATALENDVVLLDFGFSKAEEEFQFELRTSAKHYADCFILQDISLDICHSSLNASFSDLQKFILHNCQQKIQIQKGITLTRFKCARFSQPTTEKRTKYSLIIAFITPQKEHIEKIAITVHLVHVKLRPEEIMDTKIMYTYWKTNWNRLLSPQVLYDSTSNSPLSAAQPINTDDDPSVADVSFADCRVSKRTTLDLSAKCLQQTDSVTNQISNYSNRLDQVQTDTLNDTNDSDTGLCAICLSNTVTCVLTPCRHAVVCGDCFTRHKDNETNRLPVPGVVSCPLCRTPVSGIVSLPKVGSINSH